MRLSREGIPYFTAKYQSKNSTFCNFASINFYSNEQNNHYPAPY